MKRFYDVQCEVCGMVAELWIAYEEIPEEECPNCGEKRLKRKFTSFSTGPSCRTDFRGPRM